MMHFYSRIFFVSLTIFASASPVSSPAANAWLTFTSESTHIMTVTSAFSSILYFEGPIVFSNTVSGMASIFLLSASFFFLLSYYSSSSSSKINNNNNNNRNLRLKSRVVWCVVRPTDRNLRRHNFIMLGRKRNNQGVDVVSATVMARKKLMKQNLLRQ